MFIVEIVVVLLLTVVNGLLAMSELAIVSSRPARLRQMVERGVTGSRRALSLATDPGRFLSTVQIGITLVGVLSGAFSGATLGQRLSASLAALGLPAQAADIAGIGIVVAAITYLSLIVGELVPKRIALRRPEAIAVRVAPAMMLLARVMSPLVWVLDRSGRIVLSLLGQNRVSEDKVTEEEIHTLVAEAEHAGILEPGEREMITGVMRLADVPVRAVMTPRREVDMLRLSDTPEKIRETIAESSHSRLPVYETDPDEVIGIVQAKDLLHAFLTGENPDVRQYVRTAPVVPDTVDAGDVVAVLKASSIHLGLVFDEYGHFEGVVTSADILEAIVGEFDTEEGAPEPMLVRRDDGSLLVSGWMPVEQFQNVTGIVIPADRAYHTVAGFILDCYGALPGVGQSVDAHGWRFEVMDLDGRRIDKVLAVRLPPPRRGGGAAAIKS